MNRVLHASLLQILLCDIAVGRGKGGREMGKVLWTPEDPWLHLRASPMHLPPAPTPPEKLQVVPAVVHQALLIALQANGPQPGAHARLTQPASPPALRAWAQSLKK